MTRRNGQKTDSFLSKSRRFESLVYLPGGLWDTQVCILRMHGIFGSDSGG
jgi:hypothetical protein